MDDQDVPPPPLLARQLTDQQLRDLAQEPASSEDVPPPEHRGVGVVVEPRSAGAAAVRAAVGASASSSAPPASSAASSALDDEEDDAGAPPPPLLARQLTEQELRGLAEASASDLSGLPPPRHREGVVVLPLAAAAAAEVAAAAAAASASSSAPPGSSAAGPARDEEEDAGVPPPPLLARQLTEQELHLLANEAGEARGHICVPITATVPASSSPSPAADETTPISRQITDQQLREKARVGFVDAPTAPSPSQTLLGVEHAAPVIGRQKTIRAVADNRDPLIRQDASAGLPLTGSELVSFSRVGTPSVCPCGQHAAFSVRMLQGDESWVDARREVSVLELDNAEQSFVSGLFLYDATHDSVRQLTSPASGRDADPVWLDEFTVGFLSTRSGSSQIWAIDVRGGGPMQLSHLELDVANLQFNAKSSLFAFTCEVYTDLVAGSADPIALTAKRDEERKSKPSNVRLYDKLAVRSWDKWTDVGKRHHIFVQPGYRLSNAAVITVAWRLLSEVPPHDVMQGPNVHGMDCPIPPFGGAECFSFSPNGLQIALQSQTVSDSSVAWTTNTAIYLVDLGVDELTKQVCSSEPSAIASGADGYDSHPLYSPDGAFIAFFSMERGGYESDRNRIFIYNRQTGVIHETASEWDRSPHDMVWDDSSNLFVTASCTGRSRVFKTAITMMAVPRAVVGEGHNSGVSIMRNEVGARQLIFCHSSFTSPAELYTAFLSAPVQADGMAANMQVTNFNGPRIARLSMGEPEEIYFPGYGDRQMHCWFMRPTVVPKDAELRVPLAVIIHGGPQGAMTNQFHYRWNPQIYATAGYAVCMINFTGSTGYGQDVTDGVSGSWGEAPFVDIVKGVEYLLDTTPWLDRERVYGLGASYGGYMINWINANNENGLFKRLVCHDGVFDLRAMAFSTEELFFVEWEMRGLPWDDAAVHEKWSPHTRAQHMRTPTLVIHGGLDYRVPDTQGIALFTCLQRQGVESELLFFPDENHWVLNPHNSIIWHREVLRWLSKHNSSE